MWSFIAFDKPVQSAPTIVASAVLVGALMVMSGPVRSSQEAIARAATHARAAEIEAARTPTQLETAPDPFLLETAPPASEREDLGDVIRSLEETVTTSEAPVQG